VRRGTKDRVRPRGAAGVPRRGPARARRDRCVPHSERPCEGRCNRPGSLRARTHGRTGRSRCCRANGSRGVAELYPPELWPALLLTPPSGASDEWGLLAARALERVAVAEPGVPVRRCAYRHRVRTPPRPTPRCAGCRAVAGRICRTPRGCRGTNWRINSVPPAPRRHQPPSRDSPATGCRRTSAARSSQPPGRCATRYPQTQRPISGASTRGSCSSCWSQCRRTAGLFRPNHPLGFRHGHQTAEGDLVAESLKLAVEVDGAFLPP